MRQTLFSQFALLLLFVLSFSFADEKEWFVPLGMPPKAKPRRISGGEGFPPLPLPVTPLRRSERKREPSSPKLFGKVIWGETATFQDDQGQSQKYADWNLCPDDLGQLFRKVKQGNLGLDYSNDPLDLNSFSGSPEEMPVLFFSGTRTIRLGKTQLDLLRSYTLKGGMIVFDSIAGSPYFYASAKKLLSDMLPEFSIRTIPLDHPLYRIVYSINKIKIPKAPEVSAPLMEGIYIGCRIGVLLSPYGMGCGWDNHEVPHIEKAKYYDIDSANRLGVNIVAYSVAYSHVGRTEARSELFGTLDEKPATDEFVFAQIKHKGAWNVHPGSAISLLTKIRQDTSIKVSLKRIPVSPGKDDLSSFTFLYLTGLDDFQWDETEVKAIRNFLNASGTLFINNGLGMQTFDRAVRREIQKVLPEGKLSIIPLSHPLYSSFFTIRELDYTPETTPWSKNRKPCLEGIGIAHDLRILYSPVDMEAHWQGCDHVLCRGYQMQSAMQMGFNIIVYSLTH
ncbi:MAG: DUF4159 domain-containing protein [Candidatus Brocadiae bacterium]|nr:DUF4159 domain-containing protein [Candidatus Brocadiia bacterium]